MWIIYSPSFFGFFLKDISSYWKTLFYFKLLSIKHTVVHISYIPLHSRMTALNTILKFYQFSILVARYLSFISSTHYLNSKMRLRQYNFKILSYKWPGGQTWALFSAQLFAIPWTVACQAPLSMRFSRQEFWSRVPIPSLEGLPDPGIEPGSPVLQADSLPFELPGRPYYTIETSFITCFQYLSNIIYFKKCMKWSDYYFSLQSLNFPN